MSTETTPDDDLHSRQVQAVMRAVAKLLPRFEPQDMTAEAVFEGAVKGGAVALMAAGATPQNVAGLLEELATEFRQLADSETGARLQ